MLYKSIHFVELNDILFDNFLFKDIMCYGKYNFKDYGLLCALRRRLTLPEQNKKYISVIFNGKLSTFWSKQNLQKNFNEILIKPLRLSTWWWRVNGDKRLLNELWHHFSSLYDCSFPVQNLSKIFSAEKAWNREHINFWPSTETSFQLIQHANSSSKV